MSRTRPGGRMTGSSPPSLSERSQRGTRWAALVTAGNALSNGAQALIAAIVMLPADYGVFLLGALVALLGRQIVEAGLTPAVIHRQTVTGAEMRTVRALCIGLGFFLFLCAAGGAAIAWWLNADPRIGPLVLLAALSVPILSLSTIEAALLERELRYDLLCPGELAGIATGLATMATAAMLGWGPFALVFGLLANAGLRTVWIRLAIRRLQVWNDPVGSGARSDDFRGFYERFAGFQTLTTVVNFGVNRLDQAIIAAAFGPEALGLYGMAWAIVVDPVLRLNGIANRVTLALLSRVRRFRKLSQRVFLNGIRLLTTFTAPLILGGAAVAPTFVDVVMDESWRGTGELIRILAIAALARSIVNPTGALLLSHGRADIAFWWTAIVLSVQSLALTAAALATDLTGLAATVAALNVAVLLAVRGAVIVRVLPVPIDAYLRAPASSLLTAGLMALVVLAFSALPITPLWLALAVQIAAGLITYPLLTYWLDRPRLMEAATILLGSGRLRRRTRP